MKAVIIYGGLTGSNEAIAEHMEDYISKNYADVMEIEKIEGYDANPSQLKDYDFAFVGSSTWGDGDISDAMIDFIDDSKGMDLSGVRLAVFANGDRNYPQFCKSGDTIKLFMERGGAKVLGEVLKIDADVYSAFPEVEQWVDSIMKEVK